MGCGETLELNISYGDIRCTFYDEETETECPEPYAVQWLLDDPETEHIVEIRPQDFTAQHPLRERLEGYLFECEVNDYLHNLPGAPVEPGRYRMTKTYDSWVYERLSDNVSS